MLPTNRNKPVIGDCEVCDSVAVEVWMMHGNILMCSNCKGKESELTSKSQDAQALIEASKKIDSSIEIKTDLFNAGTVAAIELKAAIDADDSIPVEKKEYAFAKMCLDRFRHFQQVVFEQREELLARENEMRAWQVQVQTAAGKLKSDVQEEFKNLNITYSPVSPKTIKPKTVKAPSQKKSGKAGATEAIEAAKKYGVDATGVRTIAIARNWDAEKAAKFLATQLGLISQ